MSTVSEMATAEIATRLAAVAASVETHGQSREATADFLLRCAFTMFASGVGVLPPRCLSLAASADSVGLLWEAMVQSLALSRAGELFDNMTPLPLNSTAKALLCEVDGCCWASVDLSIFGTLVEGSFDASRRHKLGAHYTPRSYIMRIVGPTIEEPLRQEWEVVYGLSRLSRELLIAPHHTPEESERWLREFHAKLCAQRVLDPACGTGNFLIVALETLYGIEDDVLAEFAARGIALLPTDRVSPQQMRGIEIDPRAARTCRLVLQLCHLRRRYLVSNTDEAALEDCKGIECRDPLPEAADV